MINNTNQQISKSTNQQLKQLVFILIFLCTTTAYTQVDIGNNLVTGTFDTTRTIQNIVLKNRIKVPKNAVVLNLGYNFPMINNALVNKSDFWNKKTGTGVNFSVDYRKQFQKKTIENDAIVSTPTIMGMGIGVGISYFRQSAGFEKFSDTLSNYTDVDGDKCTVYLKCQNVKETVSLTYLDIPVYFEIGKLSRVKPSAYLQLGLKASVLIAKKFEGQGAYTSTGYYPKTEVMLHDVSVLGYYTNELCYNEPAYKLSPFVLWGTIAGGVNFPFSSLEKNKLAKWILRVSAKIDYSLTPISKSMEEPYFKGATFRLNQSNMLGGDGSRIFSAGLMVSLIYCL